MKISRFGENALLLTFGDKISPAVHDQVLIADHLITDQPHPALIETVPAYGSLCLFCDFSKARPASVIAWVKKRLEAKPASHPSGPDKAFDLPIDFGLEAGEDLPLVAKHTGLPVEKVIERFLANPLRLYMYGFAPGFAYLGGLDPALAPPRRETPRPHTPAGSVIIAAGQAGLMPTDMPTGWYVIGRTPICLFDAEQTPPVPFAAGSLLQPIRI